MRWTRLLKRCVTWLLLIPDCCGLLLHFVPCPPALRHQAAATELEVVCEGESSAGSDSDKGAESGTSASGFDRRGSLDMELDDDGEDPCGPPLPRRSLVASSLAEGVPGGLVGNRRESIGGGGMTRRESLSGIPLKAPPRPSLVHTRRSVVMGSIGTGLGSFAAILAVKEHEEVVARAPSLGECHVAYECQ